ncbi:hypothetical protein KM043_018282 [Ampulex compressa]|nr:hypothetical protein KM043_018282 [Ampulex compressa]
MLLDIPRLIDTRARLPVRRVLRPDQGHGTGPKLLFWSTCILLLCILLRWHPMPEGRLVNYTASELSTSFILHDHRVGVRVKAVTEESLQMTRSAPTLFKNTSCRCTTRLTDQLKTSSNKQEKMSNFVKYVVIIAIVLGIGYRVIGAVDETDRPMQGLNVPYGRGLDSEVQLTRLLLLPPRLCHPKRNSELINSLLGLPKNMNNAGK